MTDHNKRLLAYVLVTVAVVFGLVSYINKSDEARIQSQIEMCERVKADRIDNARAWTQAEHTWLQRSLDPKLSPQERKIAAKTAVVYAESANQLRSRILHCEPAIRDGDFQIDDRMLREAQGTL